MEAAAVKLQITMPEAISENKPAQKLYEEAFQSVFNFIYSTGQVVNDNVAEASQAVNNHAQNIFMAKMGIDSIDGDTIGKSSKALQGALGLKGNSEEYQEIISGFQNAADKVETYQSFIESPKAHLVGSFQEMEASKKAELLPYLQALPGALEALPTIIEDPKLNPLERLERSAKISRAVLTAVEAASVEVSSLKSLRPSYRGDGGLAGKLKEALEAPEIGIEGLTQAEKINLTEIITEDFKSQETVKEASNELQDFIGKNGKWLMMLFPMVAGPLAKAFSYIPILGKPLNALLGQIHQNSGTLITVLAGNALTGNKSERALPPQKQQAA